MSLALGVNTSTRIRIANGSDGGRPERLGTWTTYFVAREPATPSPIPPTNDHGKLSKRPMAAAPKADTTTRKIDNGSRLRLGANIRPARQVNTDPISQAHRRTRTGLSPVRDSRVGVVDDTPHRDAQAYRPEEEVEPCGQSDRHDDDDDLIPRNVRVEDADVTLGQVGMDDGVVAVPVPEGSDADDDQEQSDRGDHPHAGSHRVQDRASRSSNRPWRGARTNRQIAAATGHGSPC